MTSFKENWDDLSKPWLHTGTTIAREWANECDYPLEEW